MAGGLDRPGIRDRVKLAKHHGAGNDFLVVLDADGTRPISPELAVALCDRRRGIGADGVIRGIPAAGDETASRPYEIAATMELFNADGSRAEMSGNGIRCLGHELWHQGIVRGDDALVSTDAGVKRLRLLRRSGSRASVSVDMGEIRIRDDIAPDDLTFVDADVRRRVLRAAHVDAGNPHLVVQVDDIEGIPYTRWGEAVQGAHHSSGGVNLEVIVARPGSGTAVSQITMMVFERGVGPTQACGSGSCAAAAAVRHWGTASTRFAVTNPGGELGVDFDGDVATLSGEVVRIADIDVDATLVGEFGARC